jgi:hypothetical protein
VTAFRDANCYKPGALSLFGSIPIPPVSANGQIDIADFAPEDLVTGRRR